MQILSAGITVAGKMSYRREAEPYLSSSSARSFSSSRLSSSTVSSSDFSSSPPPFFPSLSLSPVWFKLDVWDPSRQSWSALRPLAASSCCSFSPPSTHPFRCHGGSSSRRKTVCRQCGITTYRSSSKRSSGRSSSGTDTRDEFEINRNTICCHDRQCRPLRHRSQICTRKRTGSDGCLSLAKEKQYVWTHGVRDKNVRYQACGRNPETHRERLLYRNGVKGHNKRNRGSSGRHITTCSSTSSCPSDGHGGSAVAAAKAREGVYLPPAAEDAVNETAVAEATTGLAARKQGMHRVTRTEGGRKRRQSQAFSNACGLYNHAAGVLPVQRYQWYLPEPQVCEQPQAVPAAAKLAGAPAAAVHAAVAESGLLSEVVSKGARDGEPAEAAPAAEEVAAKLGAAAFAKAAGYAAMIYGAATLPKIEKTAVSSAADEEHRWCRHADSHTVCHARNGGAAGMTTAAAASDVIAAAVGDVTFTSADSTAAAAVDAALASDVSHGTAAVPVDHVTFSTEATEVDSPPAAATDATVAAAGAAVAAADATASAAGPAVGAQARTIFNVAAVGNTICVVGPTGAAAESIAATDATAFTDASVVADLTAAAAGSASVDAAAGVHGVTKRAEALRENGSFVRTHSHVKDIEAPVRKLNSQWADTPWFEECDSTGVLPSARSHADTKPMRDFFSSSSSQCKGPPNSPHVETQDYAAQQHQQQQQQQPPSQQQQRHQQQQEQQPVVEPKFWYAVEDTDIHCSKQKQTEAAYHEAVAYKQSAPRKWHGAGLKDVNNAELRQQHVAGECQIVSSPHCHDAPASLLSPHKRAICGLERQGREKCMFRRRQQEQLQSTRRKHATAIKPCGVASLWQGSERAVDRVRQREMFSLLQTQHEETQQEQQKEEQQTRKCGFDLCLRVVEAAAACPELFVRSVALRRLLLLQLQEQWKINIRECGSCLGGMEKELDALLSSIRYFVLARVEKCIYKMMTTLAASKSAASLVQSISPRDTGTSRVSDSQVLTRTTAVNAGTAMRVAQRADGVVAFNRVREGFAKQRCLNAAADTSLAGSQESDASVDIDFSSLCGSSKIRQRVRQSYTGDPGLTNLECEHTCTQYQREDGSHRNFVRHRSQRVLPAIRSLSEAGFICEGFVGHSNHCRNSNCINKAYDRYTAKRDGSVGCGVEGTYGENCNGRLTKTVSTAVEAQMSSTASSPLINNSAAATDSFIGTSTPLTTVAAAADAENLIKGKKRREKVSATLGVPAVPMRQRSIAAVPMMQQYVAAVPVRRYPVAAVSMRQRSVDSEEFTTQRSIDAVDASISKSYISSEFPALHGRNLPFKARPRSSSDHISFTSRSTCCYIYNDYYVGPSLGTKRWYFIEKRITRSRNSDQKLRRTRSSSNSGQSSERSNKHSKSCQKQDRAKHSSNGGQRLVRVRSNSNSGKRHGRRAACSQSNKKCAYQRGSVRCSSPENNTKSRDMWRRQKKSWATVARTPIDREQDRSSSSISSSNNSITSTQHSSRKSHMHRARGNSSTSRSGRDTHTTSSLRISSKRSSSIHQSSSRSNIYRGNSNPSIRRRSRNSTSISIRDGSEESNVLSSRSGSSRGSRSVSSSNSSWNSSSTGSRRKDQKAQQDDVQKRWRKCHKDSCCSQTKHSSGHGCNSDRQSSSKTSEGCRNSDYSIIGGDSITTSSKSSSNSARSGSNISSSTSFKSDSETRSSSSHSSTSTSSNSRSSSSDSRSSSSRDSNSCSGISGNDSRSKRNTKGKTQTNGTVAGAANVAAAVAVECLEKWWQENFKAPSSVAVQGPPGSGKQQLCRAIAVHAPWRAGGGPVTWPRAAAAASVASASGHASTAEAPGDLKQRALQRESSRLPEAVAAANSSVSLRREGYARPSLPASSTFQPNSHASAFSAGAASLSQRENHAGAWLPAAAAAVSSSSSEHDTHAAASPPAAAAAAAFSCSDGPSLSSSGCPVTTTISPCLPSSDFPMSLSSAGKRSPTFVSTVSVVQHPLPTSAAIRDAQLQHVAVVEAQHVCSIASPGEACTADSSLASTSQIYKKDGEPLPMCSDLFLPRPAQQQKNIQQHVPLTFPSQQQSVSCRDPPPRTIPADLLLSQRLRTQRSQQKLQGQEQRSHQQRYHLILQQQQEELHKDQVCYRVENHQQLRLRKHHPQPQKTAENATAAAATDFLTVQHGYHPPATPTVTRNWLTLPPSSACVSGEVERPGSLKVSKTATQKVVTAAERAREEPAAAHGKAAPAAEAALTTTEAAATIGEKAALAVAKAETPAPAAGGEAVTTGQAPATRGEKAAKAAAGAAAGNAAAAGGGRAEKHLQSLHVIDLAPYVLGRAPLLSSRGRRYSSRVNSIYSPLRVGNSNIVSDMSNELSDRRDRPRGCNNKKISENCNSKRDTSNKPGGNCSNKISDSYKGICDSSNRVGDVSSKRLCDSNSTRVTDRSGSSSSLNLQQCVNQWFQYTSQQQEEKETLQHGTEQKKKERERDDLPLIHGKNIQAVYFPDETDNSLEATMQRITAEATVRDTLFRLWLANALRTRFSIAHAEQLLQHAQHHQTSQQQQQQHRQQQEQQHQFQQQSQQQQHLQQQLRQQHRQHVSQQQQHVDQQVARQFEKEQLKKWQGDLQHQKDAQQRRREQKGGQREKQQDVALSSTQQLPSDRYSGAFDVCVAQQNLLAANRQHGKECVDAHETREEVSPDRAVVSGNTGKPNKMATAAIAAAVGALMADSTGDEGSFMEAAAEEKVTREREPPRSRCYIKMTTAKMAKSSTNTLAHIAYAPETERAAKAKGEEEEQMEDEEDASHVAPRRRYEEEEQEEGDTEEDAREEVASTGQSVGLKEASAAAASAAADASVTPGDVVSATGNHALAAKGNAHRAARDNVFAAQGSFSKASGDTPAAESNHSTADEVATAGLEAAVAAGDRLTARSDASTLGAILSTYPGSNVPIKARTAPTGTVIAGGGTAGDDVAAKAATAGVAPAAGAAGRGAAAGGGALAKAARGRVVAGGASRGAKAGSRAVAEGEVLLGVAPAEESAGGVAAADRSSGWGSDNSREDKLRRLWHVTSGGGCVLVEIRNGELLSYGNEQHRSLQFVSDAAAGASSLEPQGGSIVENREFDDVSTAWTTRGQSKQRSMGRRQMVAITIIIELLGRFFRLWQQNNFPVFVIVVCMSSENADACIVPNRHRSSNRHARPLHGRDSSSGVFGGGAGKELWGAARPQQQMGLQRELIEIGFAEKVLHLPQFLHAEDRAAVLQALLLRPYTRPRCPAVNTTASSFASHFAAASAVDDDGDTSLPMKHSAAYKSDRQESELLQSEAKTMQQQRDNVERLSMLSGRIAAWTPGYQPTDLLSLLEAARRRTMRRYLSNLSYQYRRYVSFKEEKTCTQYQDAAVIRCLPVSVSEYDVVNSPAAARHRHGVTSPTALPPAATAAATSAATIPPAAAAAVPPPAVAAAAGTLAPAAATYAPPVGGVAAFASAAAAATTVPDAAVAALTFAALAARGATLAPAAVVAPSAHPAAIGLTVCRPAAAAADTKQDGETDTLTKSCTDNLSSAVAAREKRQSSLLTRTPSVNKTATAGACGAATSIGAGTGVGGLLCMGVSSPAGSWCWPCHACPLRNYPGNCLGANQSSVVSLKSDAGSLCCSFHTIPRSNCTDDYLNGSYPSAVSLGSDVSAEKDARGSTFFPCSIRVGAPSSSMFSENQPLLLPSIDDFYWAMLREEAPPVHLRTQGQRRFNILPFLPRIYYDVESLASPAVASHLRFMRVIPLRCSCPSPSSRPADAVPSARVTSTNSDSSSSTDSNSRIRDVNTRSADSRVHTGGRSVSAVVSTGEAAVLKAASTSAATGAAQDDPAGRPPSTLFGRRPTTIADPRFSNVSASNPTAIGAGAAPVALLSGTSALTRAAMGAAESPALVTRDGPGRSFLAAAAPVTREGRASVETPNVARRGHHEPMKTPTKHHVPGRDASPVSRVKAAIISSADNMCCCCSTSTNFTCHAHLLPADVSVPALAPVADAATAFLEHTPATSSQETAPDSWCGDIPEEQCVCSTRLSAFDSREPKQSADKVEAKAEMKGHSSTQQRRYNSISLDTVSPNILQSPTSIHSCHSPQILRGFDAIVGEELLLQRLTQEILLPFLHWYSDGLDRGLPSRSHNLPTGILITGEAGTGKSLLAVSLAHELKSALFMLSPAEVLRAPVGGAEKQLMSAFAAARRAAPCVLLLEDIDIIAPAAGNFRGRCEACVGRQHPAVAVANAAEETMVASVYAKTAASAAGLKGESTPADVGGDADPGLLNILTANAASPRYQPSFPFAFRKQSQRIEGQCRSITTMEQQQQQQHQDQQQPQQQRLQRQQQFPRRPRGPVRGLRGGGRGRERLLQTLLLQLDALHATNQWSQGNGYTEASNQRTETGWRLACSRTVASRDIESVHSTKRPGRKVQSCTNNDGSSSHERGMQGRETRKLNSAVLVVGTARNISNVDPRLLADNRLRYRYTMRTAASWTVEESVTLCRLYLNGRMNPSHLLSDRLLQHVVVYAMALKSSRTLPARSGGEHMAAAGAEVNGAQFEDVSSHRTGVGGTRYFPANDMSSELAWLRGATMNSEEVFRRQPNFVDTARTDRSASASTFYAAGDEKLRNHLATMGRSTKLLEKDSVGTQSAKLHQCSTEHPEKPQRIFVDPACIHTSPFSSAVPHILMKKRSFMASQVPAPSFWVFLCQEAAVCTVERLAACHSSTWLQLQGEPADKSSSQLSDPILNTYNVLIEDASLTRGWRAPLRRGRSRTRSGTEATPAPSKKAMKTALTCGQPSQHPSVSELANGRSSTSCIGEHRKTPSAAAAIPRSVNRNISAGKSVSVSSQLEKWLPEGEVCIEPRDLYRAAQRLANRR